MSDRQIGRTARFGAGRVCRLEGRQKTERQTDRMKGSQTDGQKGGNGDRQGRQKGRKTDRLTVGKHSDRKAGWGQIV